MARQPDDTLDRLLTRTLRSHTASGEVCPSAEDIAAYLERSLDVGEAQRIELHLSSCARCAEALATLVDTEPVAAPVAPADAWWSWRTWRWAVPATAVLVLGVWLASALREQTPPEQQMAQHTEAAPAEPAEAKNQEAAQESAATAVTAPAVSAPADAVAAAERPRSSESPASVSANAPAQAAGTPPQIREEVSSAARETKEETSAARARERADTAAVPPPSPSAVVAPDSLEALAKTGPSRAEPATVDARRSAQAPGRVTAAAPVGRASDAVTPTPSAAFEAAQTQGAALAAFSTAAPLLLRARAGNVVWRISGSVIERSVDGGAVWATEFRAANPVRAGVVAADDTVWLVGAGGLVLQRLPTAAWRIVPAPVMDDLVSLSDASATGITVRTASGRQFRTTNNGAIWTAK